MDNLNLGKIAEVYSVGAYKMGHRYDHFVMSHKTQIDVHVGRWKTDMLIARENSEDAVEAMKKTVSAFIEGRGVISTFFRDVMEKIYGVTQIYPPKLPYQQYVRTFVLKTSWRKELFI